MIITILESIIDDIKDKSTDINIKDIDKYKNRIQNTFGDLENDKLPLIKRNKQSEL